MRGCLWTAGLMLLVMGCGGSPAGPKTVSVAGKVTLDGNPFTDADVILSSGTTGRGYNAAIDSSGNFKFGEVVPGEYMVSLSGKSEIPTGNEPPKPFVKPVNVPDKYWNDHSSGITAVIGEDGESNLTVELLSK